MKNIGRVAEADIEINGIAVIAGENGTGKSTVGKALYAAFNSMSDSENKIDRMRRNSAIVLNAPSGRHMWEALSTPRLATGELLEE